jgi:hypothetical protein
MIEEKACSRCRKISLLSNYLRDHRASDGRQSECKQCNAERRREYRGHKPLGENKDSSRYLGEVIAERLLPAYFKDIKRMPSGNRGYDFICSNGYKIDVKSSCLAFSSGYDRWTFNIRKNVTADYFLFIGFDNRTKLTPLHVWLVPKEISGGKIVQNISDTIGGIAMWVDYEKPIDQAIECCKVLSCA